MKTGYGVFNLPGRIVTYPHRVICEAVHGPAPLDKPQAAHRCGNKLCVNPRHVRWKSQKENEEDKLTHGRDNRGERHGLAKLTTADVRKIRVALKEGRSQQSIANDLGVSQTSIWRVATGQTWGWLSE